MSQVNPKRGKYRGIARAKKERRREEAEARNEKTLPENRRKYRRQMLEEDKF